MIIALVLFSPKKKKVIKRPPRLQSSCAFVTFYQRWITNVMNFQRRPLKNVFPSFVTHFNCIDKPWLYSLSLSLSLSLFLCASRPILFKDHRSVQNHFPWKPVSYLQSDFLFWFNDMKRSLFPLLSSFPYLSLKQRGIHNHTASNDHL